MVRINILNTEITNFLETKLYDEAISAIEYYLFLNAPDEIKIPGPAHLRLLLSLALLPEAHLTSTETNLRSQQASLATRAINVLNSIKQLAKENDEVQQVLFEIIDLPTSSDRSGRRRSRRLDPDFTSYIPSNYLPDSQQDLENDSDNKSIYFNKDGFSADKDISYQTQKQKAAEIDGLIFSDDENDDEGDEYTDQALTIEPDQILFTWSSHTKSWDLIEWILLYSTVSTDFYRNRFRQLRPVLLFLLDLLVNFDKGLSKLNEMVPHCSSIPSIIFCHWTDNKFEYLCGQFNHYLSNVENQNPHSKLIPSIETSVSNSQTATKRAADFDDNELNLLHSIDIRMTLFSRVQECFPTNQNSSGLRKFQQECLPYLQRLSLPCKSAMDPDPLLLAAWAGQYKLPFNAEGFDDLTNDLVLILSSIPKINKRAQGKNTLQEYCLAVQYFLSYHLEFLADAGPEFSEAFISAYKRGRTARTECIKEFALAEAEAEECIRMEKIIYATLVSCLAG